MTLRAVHLAAFSALALAAASAPWKAGDPSRWSVQEIDQVLNNSPWAQAAGASFGLAGDDDPPPPPTIDVPQAGMPSPHNGSTDGRWDGGVARVSRNGPPTLTVAVRWESALPVREALARQHAPASFAADQIGKDYIISVSGLVPGGRYGRPELNTSSNSDSPTDTRNREAARNPEEMLEGVMRYSRLFLHNGSALRPENARIDSATGTLYLFFPRSDALTLHDKDVTFQTRFGSLTVARKFRLKDMTYNGRLEL